VKKRVTRRENCFGNKLDWHLNSLEKKICILYNSSLKFYFWEKNMHAAFRNKFLYALMLGALILIVFRFPFDLWAVDKICIARGSVSQIRALAYDEVNDRLCFIGNNEGDGGKYFIKSLALPIQGRPCQPPGNFQPIIEVIEIPTWPTGFIIHPKENNTAYVQGNGGQKLYGISFDTGDIKELWPGDGKDRGMLGQLAPGESENVIYAVWFEGARSVLTRFEFTRDGYFETPVLKTWLSGGLLVDNSRQKAYLASRDGIIVFCLHENKIIRRIGSCSGVFLQWTDWSRKALYVLQPLASAPGMLVNGWIALDETMLEPDIPLSEFGLTRGIAATQHPGLFAVSLNLEDGVSEIIQFKNYLSTSFERIGNIRLENIDENGYATIDSGEFPCLTHAVFGGTLDIYADLKGISSRGATHFALSFKERDAGTSRWRPFNQAFKISRVRPFAAESVRTHRGIKNREYLYEIPVESDGVYRPGNWRRPGLLAEVNTDPEDTGNDTFANAAHVFRLRLFKKTGNGFIELTGELFRQGGNTMVLQIDNKPPEAAIIFQDEDTHSPDPCTPVSSENHRFNIKITASDLGTMHLRGYNLSVLDYGDPGNSQWVTLDEKYYGACNDFIDVDGRYKWRGVSDEPIEPWEAPADGCHFFRLVVFKRIVNGYEWNFKTRDYYRSINVNGVNK
jgi:hypothetical protein